jgi:hypothetical protein
MEQSQYWEANSHSATQDIPLRFLETEGSLPRSQETATGPNPEPDAYSSNLLTLFPQDPF